MCVCIYTYIGSVHMDIHLPGHVSQNCRDTGIIYHCIYHRVKETKLLSFKILSSDLGKGDPANMLNAHSMSPNYVQMCVIDCCERVACLCVYLCMYVCMYVCVYVCSCLTPFCIFCVKPLFYSYTASIWICIYVHVYVF